MIEITGHFGVINQRVIKAYTGDGDDFTWGSATSIDAAAAGSEIELEAYIPGSDSSYYIHLTSWDDAMDSAGTYLQEDKSGSRGTPSIPDWDSGNWLQAGADNHNADADIDGADILNTDSGSTYDNLMYYYDGSEFLYFMLFLEADPDPSAMTYAVLIEDGANDGDYDYAISSLRVGSTNYIRIYSWSGFDWTPGSFYSNSAYYRYETTNGREHAAFCFDVEDISGYTPANDDYIKAVTKGDDERAFQGDWTFIRNPEPAADTGDFTAPTVYVPEFTTLLMPVLSVILIVGMNYRKRRNELASRV
jgi:hypothetical protein